MPFNNVHVLATTVLPQYLRVVKFKTCALHRTNFWAPYSMALVEQSGRMGPTSKQCHWSFLDFDPGVTGVWKCVELEHSLKRGPTAVG